MSLTDCKINLVLIWSINCVIINSTDGGTFTIRDTKLYFPLVTLSTQDNTKLLQQVESGFKRTINWNKYQTKISTQSKVST